MKLVTRAQWGARPPRSTTKLPHPSGTAVHWNGPSVWRAKVGDHDRCSSLVRGIQNFHMDANGWVDIAYSAVGCPHGYVFEGRWAGRRTAAQGTNDGNDRYYAVMALVGETDPITDDLLVAMRDAVATLNPSDTRPHSSFHSTNCPGPELRAWVAAGLPTDDDEQGDDDMADVQLTHTGSRGIVRAPRAGEISIQNDSPAEVRVAIIEDGILTVFDERRKLPQFGRAAWRVKAGAWARFDLITGGPAIGSFA